jgi:hypothetical protein
MELTHIHWLSGMTKGGLPAAQEPDRLESGAAAHAVGGIGINQGFEGLLFTNA